MKRVLRWAVILLLLAGAGTLIAISQIDTRFVADKISAALREATGAPLCFREAPGISLHPLGLSFGHADWHQQQPDRDLHITAEGGHVRLDIAPLLSGNLVVSEVTLRSPDIVLRLRPVTPGPQADAPAADSSSLRQEAPAGRETSQTGESMFPVPSDDLPLELQRLVVQDGRLRLDDGAGRHVEISGLQLVLTDIRSRADMGLDLALVYAVRQQQGEASGKLSARGLLRYYAPNILLRDLELAITPLTGPVPAELGPLSLRGGLALDLRDGRLKLQSTSLACAHSHMNLAGEISLYDLTFAGSLNITTAPRAVASILGARSKPSDQDSLHLSTGVEYSSRGLVLREFKATLDKTALAGSLDLRFGPRPALTSNLRMGHVNLDHWLPLPEAATRQSAPAAEADSAKAAPKPDTTDRRRNRQKADREVPPAPNGYPDVDLQLQVESLRHASLKLTHISARIQGEQGRYTASPVSLNLDSGGQVRGSAQTDLTAHSYALDVTATAVDLGGLSGMLDLGHPADGTADLRANLTTQGQDSKSLQAHVSGTGQLDIHQLRLAELAKITAEHPVLGKALPERFELVRLPLEAKQGEIISRPITITSSKINGTGQASASLPRQYLHVSADVHALGMTIPLIVKGPFSQISCSVDPRFLGNLTKGLTNALKQSGESGGRATGSAAKAVEGAACGVGSLLRGVMSR